MRNRAGRTNGRAFRPEGLEARGLLAAGVLPGLNVVEELGSVSRSAAIHGVEVTAPIAANGSVTFKFGVEAAGDYSLKVLYKGNGLGLHAEGPIGAADIPTGTPGSFETLSLALKAGDYAITASALSDQSVFVDWEVLLNTGVGQGAAQAAAVVSASLAIPLPSLAGTASLSASSSTSLAASTSAPAPPANPSSAFSVATVAARGPIGRAEPAQPISPVGPTTPDGSVPIASAAGGLPDGILASASVPAEEGDASPRESMLAALDIVDADRDRAALAAVSWFERLMTATSAQSRATTPEDAPKPGWVEADPEAMVARVAPEGPALGFSEVRAAVPEMMAGAVVVAAVTRRLAPRIKAVAKRPGFASLMSGWPPSMFR